MAINRRKVLEAARKHLARGQFDKAIAQYEKLVKEDRRDVRSLHKIGEIHLRKGDRDQAVETYRQVVEQYASQGFYLKALAVCKQALKADPTRLDLMVRLGDMYEQLQLVSDAMNTYSEVANTYVRAGETDRALGMLAKMADLDPDHIPVRIKYAEALSRAGRTQLAADEFEKSANLLKEQGRLDDYVKVAERLHYHRHNDVNIARELAEAYLNRNDPKRALTKLQICFKADPRDTRTLESLAVAFEQLGQIDKTISVYREVARIHREAGRPEDRARVLARILEMNPADTEAKRALESTMAAMPKDIASPAQPPPPIPSAAAPAADSFAPSGFEPTAVDDRPRIPAPSVAPRGLEPMTYAEFEALPLRPPGSEPSIAMGLPPPSALEAALEQADYYMTAGLVAEASSMIGDLQQALAAHPLVIDKARELESIVQTNGSAHHVEEHVSEAPAQPSMAPTLRSFPSPQPATAPERHSLTVRPTKMAELDPDRRRTTTFPEDQTFAVAEKLANDVVGVEGPQDPELVDVDAIFEQFKRGVAEQVADEDSETHFDLGIAYKEMSLFDDARREFKVAMGNPQKETVCWTMIGLSYVTEGKLAEAIESFNAGLNAQMKTPSEELGLHFELGRAYYKAGNAQLAQAHFERVHSQDPHFRNVKERLAAIGGSEDELTGRLSHFDELFRDD